MEIYIQTSYKINSIYRTEQYQFLILLLIAFPCLMNKLSLMNKKYCNCSKSQTFTFNTVSCIDF